MVGKISGAYKNTVPNDPVMPNLPIMLSVMMRGSKFVPFAEINQSFFEIISLKAKA